MNIETPHTIDESMPKRSLLSVGFEAHPEKSVSNSSHTYPRDVTSLGGDDVPCVHNRNIVRLAQHVVPSIALRRVRHTVWLKIKRLARGCQSGGEPLAQQALRLNTLQICRFKCAKRPP